MMKYKNIVITILSILVVLVLIFIGRSYWAKFYGPKTGYILTGKLFEEYHGTKEVKIKFEKLNIQQKKVLDSLYAKIQTQATNLSALKNEKNQFDNNKKLFNRLANEFQTNNKQDEAKYTAEIWQQINQYVTEYGKQNGFSFIYGANGSGSIMYADSALNITNEVLLFINNRYDGKAD